MYKANVWNKIVCYYYKELTELLGSKHNIEPLAVCGSKSLIVRQNQRTNIYLCKLHSIDICLIYY